MTIYLRIKVDFHLYIIIGKAKINHKINH